MTTPNPTQMDVVPCPFCGSPGKMIHPMGFFVGKGKGKDGGYYSPNGSRITCSNLECSCCGNAFYGPNQDADAIAWWNTRVQIEQSSRVGEGVREAARNVLSFREGDLPSKGWLKDNNASRAALANLAAALAQPPLAPVGDVREALNAIWLEAHETIPPDGKDAAFAALGRILHLASAALRSSTSTHVPEGYALVPVDEWNDAFRAFHGAFDTPIARRRDDSEYANDARTRMRKLNEVVSAAPALQAGEEG